MGSATRGNRDASGAGSGTAPELRRRYIDHRERDVATILAAMTSGDFELIARLGHNMRGTAASYGYVDIGAIGERLEAAAERQDVVCLAELLQLLDARISGERTGGLSGLESGLHVCAKTRSGRDGDAGR